MGKEYGENVFYYKDYETFHCEQNKARFEYERELMASRVFNQIYGLISFLVLPEYPDEMDILDKLTIKKNVLEGTRQFLEGVNLDVQIIDLQDILMIDKLPVPYEEQHRMLIEASRTGSIFDIPIEMFFGGNSSIGSYQSKGLDFKTVLFWLIRLDVCNVESMAEADYFHEVGHALIERNAGVYLNPLFSEYISMIFEFIYLLSLENGVQKFRRRCLNRFVERQENILYSMEHTKNELNYLVSLLLATITLEQYMEFSKKDRDEMVRKFKSILNGKATVERFLDDYDINLETDKSLVMVKRTIDRIHI